MRRGAALLSCAIALAAPRARAELPRDAFLNPPRPGNYAHFDAFTLGTELSLENRSDIEPGMSMLTTRATGALSLPYGDGSMNIDARFFLFTFGASAGYRSVYRNLAFAPGQPRTIDARINREKNGAYDTQGFGYAEGRVRVVVPLDYLFFVDTFTRRFEDRQDATFDWLHGDIHDGGWLNKDEATLFFRHRDFGAIGPYFRWMNVPKDGARENEIHLGVVYGTRPGLVTPRHGNSDLFLLEVIGKPGGSFLDREYGLHGYHVPLYILAVYRATLALD